MRSRRLRGRLQADSSREGDRSLQLPWRGRSKPHCRFGPGWVGNLYGTASAGGTSGFGVAFKLDTTGKEAVLHSFTGPAAGATPLAGLIRDSAGDLYGTTYGGGHFSGVVFEISP
jgi:uncharacterized repeat protein (TIGR03803 family)